jgi:transketolase
MATEQEIRHLKELAYDMRTKLLTLCGTYGGILHIGGDLSMTDLMIALYNYGMNVDGNDIASPSRDRFVLSKGHGAMAMYTAMSYKGFFDYGYMAETYGKLDSAFGMHPCKVHLPGVETSSGSLGQGLAIAVGMAISAKQKKQNHRVFCFVGDGESCEGEIWEAVMTAHARELNNLVVILDRNKQMMTSFSEETMKLDPYAPKWAAFGWDVTEIDGHDMKQITEALDGLKKPGESENPQVVIANTIKGKGVSFMERNIGWHAGMLSKEDMEKALSDVNAAWEKEGGAN